MIRPPRGMPSRGRGAGFFTMTGIPGSGRLFAWKTPKIMKRKKFLLNICGRFGIILSDTGINGGGGFPGASAVSSCMEPLVPVKTLSIPRASGIARYRMIGGTSYGKERTAL